MIAAPDMPKARRSLTRLFSDTFAALMNTNDPALPYDYDPTVKQVVVLGSSPTSTGTLATTNALQVSTAGLVRTTGGTLSALRVSSSTPTDFTGIAVGDWDIVASATTAG